MLQWVALVRHKDLAKMNDKEKEEWRARQKDGGPEWRSDFTDAEAWQIINELKDWVRGDGKSPPQTLKNVKLVLLGGNHLHEVFSMAALDTTMSEELRLALQRHRYLIFWNIDLVEARSVSFSNIFRAFCCVNCVFGFRFCHPCIPGPVKSEFKNMFVHVCLMILYRLLSLRHCTTRSTSARPPRRMCSAPPSTRTRCVIFPVLESAIFCWQPLSKSFVACIVIAFNVLQGLSVTSVHSKNYERFMEILVSSSPNEWQIAWRKPNVRSEEKALAMAKKKAKGGKTIEIKPPSENHGGPIRHLSSRLTFVPRIDKKIYEMACMVQRGELIATTSKKVKVSAAKGPSALISTKGKPAGKPFNFAMLSGPFAKLPLEDIEEFLDAIIAKDMTWQDMTKVGLNMLCLYFIVLNISFQNEVSDS